MALVVLPSTPSVDDDAPPPLTIIEMRPEGTRSIVVIRGDADISDRRALSTVLARVVALRVGDVVIDLTGTSFVDTAIVRTLAEGQQMLDRQGRKVTFRSPSRLAARLLDLLGLTESIEIGGAAG